MGATTRAIGVCLALSFVAVAVAGELAAPAIEASVASPPSEDPQLGAPASRVIDFAARLAELGPRPAASPGEARARDAVAAELEAIGLDVAIEEFDYQTFRIEKATLLLGGVPAAPLIVGLDPFRGQLEYEGEAVVITDPEQASASMAGVIVVTNHPLMQLMIAEHDPAVVICVSPEDLDAFVERQERDVTLEVHGTPLRLRSANVVARYGSRSPGEPEILVTSHIDAYQDSPGANDNGTGLGAMIELARAFATSPTPPPVAVRFVAFGAEENGAIGSRAYLEDHLAELSDVIAVVNLDTLGGARGPVIATTPTESTDAPGDVQNRIPESLRGRAWEGPNGHWRILHPAIIPTALTSNYPGWLLQVVSESCAELGLELIQADLISDHRTFALAGIPAISIQSREHHIHSVEDVADVLVAETVDVAMTLATEIVDHLQRRSAPDTDREAATASLQSP